MSPVWFWPGPRLQITPLALSPCFLFVSAVKLWQIDKKERKKKFQNPLQISHWYSPLTNLPLLYQTTFTAALKASKLHSVTSHVYSLSRDKEKNCFINWSKTDATSSWALSHVSPSKFVKFPAVTDSVFWYGFQFSFLSVCLWGHM